MDNEMPPDLGPILHACGYEFTGGESVSTPRYSFPDGVNVTADFRPGHVLTVRFVHLPN